MEIISFASVGVLMFGDSRIETRGKLASIFSTFKKVEGANQTDSFDDLGLHLYYTDAGYLEFVEAFEPAELIYRGISFLGRELASVITDMKSLGFSPTESDVGVKFDGAGIALTASRGVVQGVAAYRKGYYDY